MISLTIRILNQLFLGTFFKDSKAISNGTFRVIFRAWPIDIDSNIHMNNACYFRVAELCRWRLFAPSGVIGYCAKNRISFIATETSAKFLAPIRPFEKYAVYTKITSSENKWLHYTHTFEQHPDTVHSGSVPKVFAVVQAKSVLKEPNGKTVKADTLSKVLNPNFSSVFKL
jgi:acyl-CoA thioesterase FadM